MSRVGAHSTLCSMNTSANDEVAGSEFMPASEPIPQAHSTIMTPTATRKNTKTPYWPGSSQWYTDVRTGWSTE